MFYTTFNYISAQQNATKVKVKKKLENMEYNLNKSRHAQVNVSKQDYISIEADKPVLVLQYLVTHVIQGDCGVDCGSSMLMVPPMEQGNHQYLFSTTNSAGKQNVNLVITSSLRDGLLLDGKDILSFVNLSSAEPIPNWTVIDSHSNVNYSAIQVSLNPGLHNLSHPSSNGLFAATSNGHPLGMKLLDLPSLSDSVRYQTVTESVHIAQEGKSLHDSKALPTAKVEHSKSHDEINKAFLPPPQDIISQGLSPAVIAVIISLSTAVFFVIACIVGFIVVEFTCHNGEQSFILSPKVAPYEN